MAYHYGICNVYVMYVNSPSQQDWPLAPQLLHISLLHISGWVLVLLHRTSVLQQIVSWHVWGRGSKTHCYIDARNVCV